MGTRLLAIDPGTVVLGLALFDGPDLVGSRSIQVPARCPVESRIGLLMNELRCVLWWSAQGTAAIAMECPGAGNPTHRPPTLLALCTFIRQAARSEWKLPLTEYATGTITAAVAPRGWPGDRKAKLRVGVVALYGGRFQTAPQDVVDAIAVGHTYLVKARERQLLR